MEDNHSKLQELIENKVLEEYEIIVSNDEKEKKDKLFWLNKFFMRCAGADIEALSLSVCRTDRAKYAGMGGTIFFTALMATLSAGYALFSVFHNYYYAVGLGIIWGLLIFNLDRFIVNTMYSDGKETISWREFYCGLPRIIMAIFLGIVISTPLELKIFEDEISVKIQEMRQARLEEYHRKDHAKIEYLELRKNSIDSARTEFINTPIDPSIPELTSNDQLNTLIGVRNDKRSTKKNKEDNIKELNRRYRDLLMERTPQDSIEAQKIGKNIWSERQKINSLNKEINILTSQMGSLDGEILRIINEAEKRRMDEIKRFDQQIADIQKEIDELREKISNDGFEILLNNEFNGFQAKLSAFSKIKENVVDNDGKVIEDHSSTRYAALFIMLLFIVIETAPTFFKMMIPSGPYDNVLDKVRKSVKNMSETEIKKIEDISNREMRMSSQINDSLLEAEVHTNKKLMNDISKAQVDLLKTAVEKWREEELKKINENPSAYIQSNTEKA